MDEKQPAGHAAGHVYADLARRLGLHQAAAKVEGPCRGPHAGPTDETPLEKLHRLSALMEGVAEEIQTLRSATYRAQLWHQWAAICRHKPDGQGGQQKRLGSSKGSTS